MDRPTRRRAVAACLAVAAIAAPAVASAQYYGYAPRNVNVRAGPDRSYPLVGWLQEGTEIEIFGCLDSWRWCDLQGGIYRGWAYAGFLAVPYQDGWATIRDVGPESGLPVLSFEVTVYWNNFYTTWPWYAQWPWWASRPPIYIPPWRPPVRPPVIHPRPPIGVLPPGPPVVRPPRPPGVTPPIAKPPVVTPYPPSEGRPPVRPSPGHPPAVQPPVQRPPAGRPPTVVPPVVPPPPIRPEGATPRPLGSPSHPAPRPPAAAPTPAQPRHPRG
jgi:uncharacterized protein YraI